jgi:hypothetical protein
MTIVFRTDGPWGAGQGYNLNNVQVDFNFWDHEQRIVAIEDNPPVAVPPSNMTVVGSQWTIYYPDGLTFGPFTLPQAAFRPSVGVEITASTHTIVPANANGFLYLTNDGGCAISLDDDSGFAVDQEVTFYADTDGPVTFQTATGIQILFPPSFLAQIRGRGFTGAIKKRSDGVWVAVGTFAEDVTA